MKCISTHSNYNFNLTNWKEIDQFWNISMDSTVYHISTYIQTLQYSDLNMFSYHQFMFRILLPFIQQEAFIILCVWIEQQTCFFTILHCLLDKIFATKLNTFEWVNIFILWILSKNTLYKMKLFAQTKRLYNNVAHFPLGNF